MRRNEPNCTAPACSQPQCQLLLFGHDLSCDGDMLRMNCRVWSICIDLGHVLSCAKKIQRHMELPWRPVRGASELPLLAVTARDGDELTWFPIEHVHGVPLGRNVVDELEGGLIVVGLRTIGHHLERSLEDNV